MTEVIETDVVIIGGGPVGLVAAADLNAHGIRSVIIESRRFLEAPNVKCNHVSSRTMERFRQLGFADKIRASGLPGAYAQDVAFCVSMTGHELARIPIPSRDNRFTSRFGPDTAWATPEPPHRINQTYMEPVMMEHVAGLEHVSLLNEQTYLDFTEDATGVTVHFADNDGRNPGIVRARYLIGADGSRSSVRKQIGAKLSGDAVLSHVQSTCIRAEGLYDLMQGREAWGWYTFNTQRNGHVYAIDGKEVFLVHTYLSEAEAASDSVDRDWAIRSILGVDDEFSYEVLSKEDWVARRLVADKFREGRAFLAGDACHLWVPYAGYGMNAGIADVLNLTWLLSAVIRGWGAENMLDAYQTERLPITEQVSHFVKNHQRKLASGSVPANIDEDTAAAEAARRRLAREVYDLNVQQFAAEGLNFGYYYSESPLIAYDGEKPPPFDMGSYQPSTAPGCRAPHFWLSDDVSLYDELGSAYTLIALDSADGATALHHAAEAVGMPIKTITVNRALVPTTYVNQFTLVRQDQHVVWRGDRIPADPAGLIAQLRGVPSR